VRIPHIFPEPLQLHALLGTDHVSPVDHHVGQHLKTIMAGFYKSDFAENKTDWTANGLSSSQRRMKMAIWAAAAWKIIGCDEDFLRSAFVSTGFLFATDGSDMGRIKIKGVEGYDFTT
jgi:hypothetical protein